MRSFLAVGFGGAAGIALVACSALTDTSGLVGSVPSSESDANEGATAEASDLDVKLPVDTGADSAGDGSPSGFCASAAPPMNFFCDDFDEAPLGTGWSSISGGSEVFIDTTEFVSSPRSLRMSHPGDGGASAILMVKNVPLAVGKSIRVSFDFRPEETLNDHIAGFSGLDSGGVAWRVEFDTSILIAYFAATTTSTVSLRPEVGVWHHFVLLLDHSAPGATVRLERDGVVSASIALPATAFPSVDTTIGVRVGPSLVAVGESWHSWHDNLVIEVL